MSSIFQLLPHQHQYFKTGYSKLGEFLKLVANNLPPLLHKVKRIGASDGMSEYEKNRLGIFNYLNFFQLLSGFIVPVAGIFYAGEIPVSGWLVACMPPLVSIAVLFLNKRYKYQEALLVYFILYPVFTCLSYINGVNFGVELSFILYGILAVFFIRNIGYMIFSIGFSMISYFILSVVLKRYPYQLEQINFIGYLFNQALAIVYIFYGLYLIKKENTNYQLSMSESNTALQKTNEEMQKQAEELDQLNSLKNKLFTVISHDLKAPMYALRNLFDDIQKQDMPANEIKE
ncbi:MAG TPA: hypothetical protein VJ111_03785, partial [Chitinophagaceae bacterium]|nr:hypothetical protein [Chitinophagaceae bacterium]